jgi:hypothetical protein
LPIDYKELIAEIKRTRDNKIKARFIRKLITEFFSNKRNIEDFKKYKDKFIDPNIFTYDFNLLDNIDKERILAGYVMSRLAPRYWDTLKDRDTVLGSIRKTRSDRSF